MPMKFRAHDTFFIRKGWLPKGMRCVAKKPDVFIAKDDNPMDILGIGANMVKALRYWLPTVGLTEEAPSGVRTQKLTKFGGLVYENDKFIEEIGTLYLLHYNLVKNQANATAWYWFYNKFEAREFTKDDFLQQIQNYISLEDKDANVALRSLEDDFACITEHRGVGFMQGLVFDRPVGPIINDAMDHGLIMINAGSNILRFVPALITERQHIDEMAQILRGAIERNA